MAGTFPLLIDASKIVCRVARDRSNFLLTIHSRGNPSIDIRFPIGSGRILLAQIQNMVDTAATAPDRKPRTDPTAH
jgi:hypothetical protein